MMLENSLFWRKCGLPLAPTEPQVLVSVTSQC